MVVQAGILKVWGDRIFRVACYSAALVVPSLILLLVVLLIKSSLPSLQKYGIAFLYQSDWDPSREKFGSVPFIYGTLMTSALAMLIALPLGVAASTFLCEIAHRKLARPAMFLIELLAAIPSVVYGFWGIFFVVPMLQPILKTIGAENDTGRGLFTAGIVLAVMVAPFLTSVSFEVCKAVPMAQRQGAIALGATRWQMISRVVLPYAWPGILGASFLSLGRALGETMAVAMVIGNQPQVHFTTWNSPVGPISFPALDAAAASIPSVIANQLSGAMTELQRSALVELGLVLLLVTLVVNSAARLLIWRSSRTPTQADDEGEAKLVPPDRPEKPETRAARRAELGQLLRKARSKFSKRNSAINQSMTILLGVGLLLLILPLFNILGFVAYRGFQSLDWAFFTKRPPLGLGHAILGTLTMVGLAPLFGVPIGLFAALFLSEFRNSKLVPVVRFVGDLLGSTPSIIIGIFAYTLIVQPMHTDSAWAGAFALGMMMIPVVMRSSEEALKLVPASLREGSYALGANQAQTALRVLLPAALPAVVTGVILSISRVAGETAPLLFTAGNTDFWPKGLNEPTPFLTYYIYYYSSEGYEEKEKLAFAGALVLLGFVMVLNLGIRVIAARRAGSTARAD
jgi:phosphate transport system permease protein